MSRLISFEITVLPEIDTIEHFKELPFYKKPIEKPKTIQLKSIDLLAELPFYEQLSIIKTNQAFEGYAMSYKVELIEKNDPIVQLESSKPSIKDSFSDLVNETKDFKYQITVQVLLRNISLMEKLNLLQFILIQ